MICLSFTLSVLMQLSYAASIIDLKMPDVVIESKDTYLCHAYKLDDKKPIYLTGFETNSNKTIAHHILMYTCETPGSDRPVWNCDNMERALNRDRVETSPVCKGKSQRYIYGWAMDAPPFVLPKDVAFKVGGETVYSYIVMQVHYANIDFFKDGKTDNSGVKITTQDEPVMYEAGIYLLLTDGFIRPKTKEYFEAACQIREDVSLIPFAYRVHTHKLGVVNSGYIIKTNKSTSEQEWIELGRRSPQLPQMFYPINNTNLSIHKNDIIALRCTMFNSRDKTVFIGSTGDDEMCNFYLMYYGKAGTSLTENMCMSFGPPNWYFKSNRYLDLSKIPKEASELPADQMEELPNAVEHTVHDSNDE